MKNIKLIVIIVFLFTVTHLTAQFGGGAGTEQDPWQIATAEHLNNIRDYLGAEHSDKHFIQTADIDLGVPPWNEGEGWEPIGTHTNSFQGTYNGDGYSIEGIYIDRTTTVGLFGYIENSVISNLSLYNSILTGMSGGGILAGRTGSGSSISNVTVSGTVTGDSSYTYYVGGLVGMSYGTTITGVCCDVTISGGSIIGGLAAQINMSTIAYSYSKGLVIGTGDYEHSAGGLIGRVDFESSITDSYSTSNVYGHSRVGGFIGYSSSANIYDCYSTGEVVGEGYAGGFIGFTNYTVHNCYWDIETSGTDISAGGEGRTTAQMLSAQTFTGWDFSETWDMIEDFSYPAFQYQELSSYPVPGPSNLTVSYSDQTVYLDWELPYNTPAGYRVYRDGLLLNEDGLITVLEYTDTTSLPNNNYSYYVTAVFDEDGILFESASSNSGYVLTVEFAGGDGSENDPYQVENSEHLYAVRFFLDAHYLQTNDIDLNVPPWNEGEGWEPIKKGFNNFSGCYDGGGHTISELYINRPEDTNQGLWSLINGGEVKNLQLVGINVTGRNQTGGLAGLITNNSIIINSVIAGNIQGTHAYVGGLAGRCVNSQIIDCDTDVTITGTVNVIGGLAGLIDSSQISNCSTEGYITTAGGQAGGLIGKADESEIIGCSSTMEVTAADLDSGGLTGYSLHTGIFNSNSSGSVSGTGAVGGLVGYAQSCSINGSYSTSRVSGSNYSVGGLVGRNRSTAINDSYTAGSVFSSHSWVGGLLGVNSGGEITNCYSASYVTGWGNHIGGLIGFGENQEVSNSYWNTELSGLTESGGGEGLTISEMLQATTYSEWDFINIWILEENFSYPALLWQDSSSYPIPGPTHLAGYGDDAMVHLFWDAPFNEPSGYKIYRNGILLNEDYLITDTEYMDQDVNNWEPHTYFVTAIFSFAGEQVESLRSDYLEVTPVQFAGGNGSIDSPYLIETAYQLANVRLVPAFHFLQVADINLGVPPWSEGEGWVPIGTSNTDSFRGSYDGNGYSINYLYINRPGEERQGLFGTARFALLKNVTLVQADIVAAGFAGILAGSLRDTTVENCTVSGGVTASDNFAGGLVGYASNSLLSNSYSNCIVNGSNYAGGLLGQSLSAVIDNCQTEGSVTGNNSVGGLIGRAHAYSYTNNSNSFSTVSGNSRVGGLIGDNSRSILINSYSNSVVNGAEDSIGGLVGLNEDSQIHNCYSRSPVSGYRYVGGLVGFNHQNSHSSIVEYGYSTGPVSGTIAVGGLVGVSTTSSQIRDSYWNTDTSGTAYSSGGEGRTTSDMTWPYAVDTFSGWDFTYAWAEDQNHDINEGYPYLDFNTDNLFVGGTGTEEDPFLIDRLANLKNIRYFLGLTNSDKHFKLVADIDLSSSSRNQGEKWLSLGTTQINSFQGHFDGNGHTITGLYINEPVYEYQGLFGYTQEAKVRNVGIINAEVTGVNYVGVLIGYARSTDVKNCFSTGLVNATNSVGGLIGSSTSDTLIEECYSRTEVNAFRYAGGLVGYHSSSTIRNSFSTGNITGINALGGLTGGNYSDSVVEKSYSIGAVNGVEQLVGGLTGYNSYDAVVIYSYWDIETSGQDISPAGEGRTTSDMTWPYAGNTYIEWDFQQIWLIDTDYSLNNGYPFLAETVVSADLPVTPQVTKMLIYPNPFNPETTIRLMNPQEKPDELVIYNLKGQKVRGIKELEEDDNSCYYIWDGRNDYDKTVASGVYFVIIRAEGRLLESGKMLLLK